MNICSNCGYKLECNTPVDKEDQLTPGSISICINCGQVCVFSEDLSLRDITVEELEEIKKQAPETYFKLTMVKIFIKERTQCN